MRVGCPVQVDALTGTFGGRVDDVQAQVLRHVDQNSFGQLKLTGLILDVGEPVDVELKDLGRILDTQSVAGAKVLIHTYAKLGHGFSVQSLSCCFTGVSGGSLRRQEQLVLRAP